ncbi:Secreted RxLR effector peptide protein [Phytophthora palmivora]|uniref:Secreted RxLR effector peptide protein n=1 Tax=Phytophthora palmivora TaxID=4796 RepID=A0A2P4YT91_9STRA|nr:Secreted RxLR effector peptide protein [Phytophthora palmivora]
MEKRLIALVVVVTFIATTLDVAAETAIHQQDNLFTSRYLKSTRETEENEERAGPLNTLTRLKGLFRSDKNKMKEMKLDKRSATEALSKVKALAGLGKTPTKMTPTKIKNLETYARDNPDKWDAMTYYLENVYGIALMAFLAGGAIFFGWRYYYR